MKDFRGQLPLTESDFARIRADVLARTHRRRSAVLAFRWALAAMAVALAGIIAFWPGRPLSAPTAVATSTITRTVSPNPILAPALPTARSKPTSPERIAAATPQQRRMARKHLASAPSPEPLADIRMEIQTSDPDIRIIWLPNQETQTAENRS